MSKKINSNGKLLIQHSKGSILNKTLLKKEKTRREFLIKVGKELEQDLRLYSQKDSAKDNNEVETRVLAWGSGSKRQLGLNDERYRLRPALVDSIHQLPDVTSVQEVCCGDLFTVVISDRGHMYIWGHLTETLTLAPERIRTLGNIRISSVSCGSEHVALVTSLGDLWTMGNGSSGRLGHGNELKYASPSLVKTLKGKVVTQVVCGEEHTVLLTRKRSIFTFGNGRAGQLGHGGFHNCLFPEEIDPFYNSDSDIKPTVDRVFCGRNHSALLTTKGIAYTWGWGENGRLGHGNEECMPRPAIIEFFLKKELAIQDMSCGGAHSIALTSNQKMYTWGWGVFGQLGIKGYTGCFLPKLIKFSFDGDVTKIICGYAHSAVITSTGKLYTWGFGEEGQLGNGYESNVYTPMVIPMKKSQVLSISLGRAHSVALISSHPEQEIRKKQHERVLRESVKRIQRYLRVRKLKDKIHERIRDKAKLRYMHQQSFLCVQNSLMEHFKLKNMERMKQEQIEEEKLKELIQERIKNDKLRIMSKRKEKRRHEAVKLIQTHILGWKYRRSYLKYLMELEEKKKLETEKMIETLKHEQSSMLQEDRMSILQEKIDKSMETYVMRFCAKLLDSYEQIAIDTVVRMKYDALVNEEIKKTKKLLVAIEDEKERKRREDERRRKQQVCEMLKEKRRQHEAKLEALTERLSSEKLRHSKYIHRTSPKTTNNTTIMESNIVVKNKKYKLKKIKVATKEKREKEIPHKLLVRKSSNKQLNDLGCDNSAFIDSPHRTQGLKSQLTTPSTPKMIRDPMKSPAIAVRPQVQLYAKIRKTGPRYIVIPGQERPNYVLDTNYANTSIRPSSTDELRLNNKLSIQRQYIKSSNKKERHGYNLFNKESIPVYCEDRNSEFSYMNENANGGQFTIDHTIANNIPMKVAKGILMQRNNIENST